MSKILSLDETKELLVAWRENGDREAYTSLAVYNFGLVNTIAQRFYGSGVDYNDLFSAGTEGLIKAINKFDYEKYSIGAFSNYASTSIENQIGMELRSYNKHKHVISFEEQIDLGDEGDHIQVSDLIGSDDEEICDLIISKMKADIIREVLKCLTPRERQIIIMRYGLDEQNCKTQKEIANGMGCTRAWISRQEKSALLKLRRPENVKRLKLYYDK